MINFKNTLRIINEFTDVIRKEVKNELLISIPGIYNIDDNDTTAILMLRGKEACIVQALYVKKYADEDNEGIELNFDFKKKENETYLEFYIIYTNGWWIVEPIKVNLLSDGRWADKNNNFLNVEDMISFF